MIKFKNTCWWEQFLDSRTYMLHSKEHGDFANRFSSFEEFSNFIRFRLQDEYYPIVIGSTKITVFVAIDNILKGKW